MLIDRVGFAILFALFMSAGELVAQTFEYKQITAIESVVPMGLGRSRLITTSADDQIIEKELKNFFSAVGINFSNIRNNDREIAERLSELAAEGWILDHVTSASYGHEQSIGIYITRYIFKRAKK
jgi:hypothetical protein